MTQELPFDGVGVAPAKSGWREYLSTFLHTSGRAKAALIGCLILMAVSPSGLSALVPFVIPAFAMESGTSAAIAILLFTTIPLIIAPLILPFAGRWVDRIGPRAIAVPAAVLYAGSTALVPMVSGSNPALGVALVFAALFGFAATLAVVFRVISDWFPDHKGMGFALIGAVSSLASAILSPVFQWLINGNAPVTAAGPPGATAPAGPPPAAPPVGTFLGIGWENTYYLVAIAIAVLAIPAAMWLISEPANVRRATAKGIPDSSALPGFTLKKAVRTRAWIYIALFLAFAAAGPMAVRLNSVDFFGERGFDSSTIAFSLSALFIASIIGLMVGGTTLDRSRRAHPWIVVPMIAAVPAGLLISFFNQGNVPLLFIGMALLGFATGAESSLGPFLIARYFGLKAFAQIQGLTLAISTLSLGLAPFLISALSISMGSYTAPFMALTVLTLIATLLAALLPKYPAPWRMPRPAEGVPDQVQLPEKLDSTSE